MSRRRALAVVTGGLLVGGLAAPALATTTSDPQRHKVCVILSSTTPNDPNAPGECVTWTDPTL